MLTLERILTEPLLDDLTILADPRSMGRRNLSTLESHGTPNGKQD